MKKREFKWRWILLAAVLIIGTYSCQPGKHYLSGDFRQTYTDLNEVLHRDTTQIPFFKVHFKNGRVSILDQWGLNGTKDSLNGLGRLYDFNRNEIQQGELWFASFESRPVIYFFCNLPQQTYTTPYISAITSR